MKKSYYQLIFELKLSHYFISLFYQQLHGDDNYAKKRRKNTCEIKTKRR